MEASNKSTRSIRSEPGVTTTRHRSLDSSASRMDASDAGVSGRFTSTTSVLGPEPVRPGTDLCSVNLSKLTLTDVVSVMLVCVPHQTLALTRLEGKGVWFPSVNAKPTVGLHRTASQLIARLLMSTNRRPKTDTVQVVHQLRVQNTATQLFLTRTLFFAELDSASTLDECCLSWSVPPVTWYRFPTVVTVAELWGVEPILWVNRLLTNRISITAEPTKVVEYTLDDTIALMWNQSTTPAEMFRHACGNAQCTVRALYSEFVQHCFPSEWMSWFAFSRYVTAADLTFVPPGHEPNRIFRAFRLSPTSVTGAEVITLLEFGLGLAALDRDTKHGGPFGLERVGYIFRYYAQQSTKTGSASGESTLDVRAFARDLMVLRNQDPNTIEALTATVQSLNTSFGVTNESGEVNEAAFKNAVGSLQVRGTSNMFRACKSPIGSIVATPLYDPEMKCTGNGGRPAQCALCQKNFVNARHTVTLLPNGTAINPNTQRQKNLRSLVNEDRIARQKSKQLFSKNLFNGLMDAIRQFNVELIDGGTGSSSDWTVNRAKWAKKIATLCAKVREAMVHEPRVVAVKSPTFVLGDIHGNLVDLMAIESVLWPGFPACITANYLFLGDYVDRGDHSVECITYLLAAKMLAPDRFHLLRGNHELRQIQIDFTFLTECHDKFGAVQGQHVWEQFNQVFDCMPVCAVIEGRIFCAHGGIPASVTCLTQVERLLPCPMTNPEPECPVAWEILWNDPITAREYDQLVGHQQAERLPPAPARFVHNNRRGTGYCFADAAVEAFLTTNGLSHVIRGHEVCPTGFNYHAEGRVITVFSCSNYLTMRNDAAVILVAPDGKLRPITVCDGGNNRRLE